MAPRIPLIFGTMTIGNEGVPGVRTGSPTEAQNVIDTFANYGKELDTARVYGGGSTEQVLSQLDLHDCVLDSKAHPYEAGAHNSEKLRASVETSLATLKNKKIRTLYLHWPDRATPFAETMETLNQLHKEGKFEYVGLSNFASWEVAECVTLCRANGWVAPSVYQGMYNGITRALEEELVPCLRKYNMRLVVYNPLAGGLLTGKYSRDDASTIEKGGRFDDTIRVGKMYQERYFRDAYWDGIEAIKTAADKHKLTMPEVALRWCQHHSILTPHDGIILGASSSSQVRWKIGQFTPRLTCTHC